MPTPRAPIPTPRAVDTPRDEPVAFGFAARSRYWRTWAFQAWPPQGKGVGSRCCALMAKEPRKGMGPDVDVIRDTESTPAGNSPGLRAGPFERRAVLVAVGSVGRNQALPENDTRRISPITHTQAPDRSIASRSRCQAAQRQARTAAAPDTRDIGRRCADVWAGSSVGLSHQCVGNVDPRDLACRLQSPARGIHRA